MTNPVIHRVLVTTGCLLWIASFFGEAFSQQPYSTIGLVVSPPITIVGLVFWLKYYKQTRGHYPKLTIAWINMRGNPISSFQFMLSHILEFWIATILFWMALVLAMVLTFRNSDAFETTKTYCQSNSEILSRTGEIKFYGVLVGGTMSTRGQDGS